MVRNKNPNFGFKKRQIRMTYQDTKESSSEVRNFCENKMLNGGKLSRGERDAFIDVFDDCILSHGSYMLRVKIPGWGRLDFGNFENFVHKFTRALILSDENAVIMIDPATGLSFYVPADYCWKIILEKLEEIKTFTLGEATHMSREAEVREEVTTHRVSLEEKLKRLNKD